MARLCDTNAAEARALLRYGATRRPAKFDDTPRRVTPDSGRDNARMGRGREGTENEHEHDV